MYQSIRMHIQARKMRLLKLIYRNRCLKFLVIFVPCVIILPAFLPPGGSRIHGRSGLGMDYDFVDHQPVMREKGVNEAITDNDTLYSDTSLALKYQISGNKTAGYHGEAVVVDKENLSEEEKKKFDEGWQNYAFNEYVSNMISIDRPLIDYRDKQCLPVTYPKNLPNTSVVICFHNEAITVLLRTIHSVINKSPRHLLHEIILIDDASYFEHLDKPLRAHIAELPVTVKLIRTQKREGLIRARLLGAEFATGKTVTFLDSHCECTEGWLEPLMARIADGWNHVVCPVITTIDKTTFKLGGVSVQDMTVGTFNWRLHFRWSAISKELNSTRKSAISPLPSPTMAGGLFSIDRDYFNHIGTYDDEMDFWGGENLEISFRIWMCGGTLEIVPCSIVGHVFRDRAPYTSNPGSFEKNTVRVALVWLDDYKQLYFDTLGKDLPQIQNIKNRINLRKRLNCKSFDWYMKNIYTNAFYPWKADKTGQLSNDADPSMCIDSLGDYDSPSKTIQWSRCQNSSNQRWYYVDKVSEIRQLCNCLDLGSLEDRVGFYPCHDMGGNQHVKYTEDKTIYFKLKHKCVEGVNGTADLQLRECNGSNNQKWSWKT